MDRKCIVKGFGEGYPEALVGKPAFGWYCTGMEGSQKKYRIRVSRRNGTELWDSGWIESESAEDIVYEGTELDYDKDYSVQASIENEMGDIIDSDSEYFSTGLKSGEWKADWLCAQPPVDNAPLFRKEFLIKKKVRRARIYLCGLGYHELYINGRKAGEDLLAPAYTDYRKRICYVSYDISSMLQEGINCWGVWLGKGWYGTILGFDCGQILFSGEMSVEYEDGEKEWLYVKENDEWLTNSRGPVKENSLYIGEIYDARDEIEGWSMPGEQFKKTEGWKPVIGTEPPKACIVPQNVEPIRCIDRLCGQSVAEIEKGVYIIDFGQNLAGVVELLVDEPEGAQVIIRYSELLDDNGKLNTANLRTAQARDIFISKGKKQTYCARFTYHGFRYIEISGMSKAPDKTEVQALVLRSAVRKNGEFCCADALVNKIQSMCQWTESNNLHGVPTDCPQRDERLGWLNDLTVRAEEAVYNFDMHRFYRKYLQDIRDAQGSVTGAITDTVPFVRYGNQPADPVCSSYLILGWLLYMHYGDKDVLSEYYDSYAAWTDFLAGHTCDGIVTYSYYGDWAAPVTGTIEGSNGAGAVSCITPGELMSTGFLYYNARLMGQMAAVLDKTEDLSKWKELEERTKKALNDTYYHDEGFYASNSQASNTFMVWLGISPDKDKTVQQIVNDVYRHDIHLTTGNICSRYILEVLAENGYIDLAYDLVTQTTYPSWGYMAEKGATTTWERWEYVESGPLLGMASHDHPMYATVSAWFYRYLLGVQPLEPGFRTFKVQPCVPQKLKWAEGSLNTDKGKIEVKWNQENCGVIEISVNVPFHSKCCLIPPENCGEMCSVNDNEIMSEDKTIWLQAGCHTVRFKRGRENNYENSKR